MLVEVCIRIVLLWEIVETQFVVLTDFDYKQQWAAEKELKCEVYSQTT